MVLKSMDAYSAAQSGDTATCAAGAAECEAFALAEGATAVCAEAAFLWVCAGQLDRARALVHTFHGPVLDDLPRDVNWLLTLQCVLEAALAVADREVVEKAARLLSPYEGRAVFNAGAVMFHGVTDDTLARAAALLGDPDRAARLRARALATYERLGAHWWRDRLASWRPPVGRRRVPRPRRVHLHPAPGGLWLIGPEGAAAPLRALRGFGYLRELLRRPGQPVAALDLVGAGTASPCSQGSATSSTSRPSRPTGNGSATSIKSSPRLSSGPTSAGWTPCAPNATHSWMSSPAPPVSGGVPGRRLQPGTRPGRREEGHQRRDRPCRDRRPAARPAPPGRHPHRPELQLRARPRRQPGLGARLTNRGTNRQKVIRPVAAEHPPGLPRHRSWHARPARDVRLACIFSADGETGAPLAR